MDGRADAPGIGSTRLPIGAAMGVAAQVGG